MQKLLFLSLLSNKKLDFLINYQKPWYQQEAVISAIISSFVALILGLGIVEKIKSWFLRPVIEPISFYLTRQLNTLYLGRLKLKNIGKSTAKNVIAEVEIIKDNGKRRDNFIPVPLGWTHQHAFHTSPAQRNIYEKQIAFLDIFEYCPIPTKQIELCIQAGKEIQDFSEIKKGRTTLIIRLSAENSISKLITIFIDWNGRNSPTVEIL